MNIREKQSTTSTDPVISSSAGRLDKIPLLDLRVNNKYPLNIMHKYNVYVTANFQIQGPIDSGNPSLCIASGKPVVLIQSRFDTCRFYTNSSSEIAQKFCSPQL